MSKKFSELTKEELTKGVVNFIIPRIISQKNTLISINMDKEDGKGRVVEKKGDEYFIANVTWAWWDSDSTFIPDWKEISKEEFIEILREVHAELSLNKLRESYKNHEWEHRVLQEKEVLERKIEFVKNWLEI